MAVLSTAQVKLFLQVAANEMKRSQFHNIYKLACFTGMREGEGLGLRWKDVDLEQGVLHVRQILYRMDNNKPILKAPKTEASMAEIPLSPQVHKLLSNLHLEYRTNQKTPDLELCVRRMRCLERYCTKWHDLGEQGDLVFNQGNGKPLHVNNIRREMKGILKKAGLPHVTFHSLRHSYADLLEQANVEVKTRQGLMRHADSGLTLGLYTRVNDELKRQAAQAVDSILG